MKFNSQICTTEEQSARLLALGLKKETADMTLRTELDVCYTIPFQEFLKYFANRHLPPHPTILPAWSLHRLIEMLGVWYLELWFNTDVYDQVITLIAERIEDGLFNKKYLEE